MKTRSDGRLTVMLVSPNLDIGGAQEMTRTLAKYLARTGCSTVVCTFRDGPVRRDIEAMKVPVEVLPDRRYSVVALPAFIIEMMRRRRDLVGLVRKYGVDVVQIQTLGTVAFLLMSLRLRSKVQVWWTIPNVIFMVREETVRKHRWLLGPKQAAHRWLYRNGARFVNGIIAVSDEVARSFSQTVGYSGKKIVVLPNAVDVELYPSPEDRAGIRARLGFLPGDHLMTMVGTFKRQKGHAYLVEAAAAVVPRFPELHILLVGNGEHEGEVRTQVRLIGLSDRIHFLGSRRDVPDILKASDSFVLPSLWEGLPVALIEAMASVLPIIATRVSGTNQVMVDGLTGWLVTPGDSPALARAMTELLSDHVRAAGYASAARERVASRFSALEQAERLYGLYMQEYGLGIHETWDHEVTGERGLGEGAGRP
jgi:glycosyltransferase involved in cell wall biosynthesis